MRILLAAPPPDSNEEKEAITMANKATSKGEPAKQVAIDVLRKADEPLHAKEIAKRVLASGRCAGLKGKTPKATISAMLALGSKPGGLAGVPPPATASKPAASKRSQTHKTASTRSKAKSANSMRTRSAAKLTRLRHLTHAPNSGSCTGGSRSFSNSDLGVRVVAPAQRRHRTRRSARPRAAFEVRNARDVARLAERSSSRRDHRRSTSVPPEEAG
jgi:hypothetical protein